LLNFGAQEAEGRGSPAARSCRGSSSRPAASSCAGGRVAGDGGPRGGAILPRIWRAAAWIWRSWSGAGACWELRFSIYTENLMGRLSSPSPQHKTAPPDLIVFLLIDATNRD